MDFLSVEESAKILGLSERRIQRMIVEEDKFPGARKFNPAARRSPYMLPAKEVWAEKKRRDTATKNLST